MAEDPPVLPIQSPGEQTIGNPPPQTDPSRLNSSASKKRLMPWKFLKAFMTPQPPDKEQHALYKRYHPYAESIRIAVQMLIGTILLVLLLVKFIIDILTLKVPNLPWATLNPLEIIAYGLFFSTGIDLAYMLFTPGPDEAIGPLMTGLAAAILLGIGKIDYSKIQLQQGVILFLAIAALAGLFAIRKFLFDSSTKAKKSPKSNLDTSLE
jgi:hypothetical protein